MQWWPVPFAFSLVYNRLRQAVRANTQAVRRRGTFAQNFAIAFSGTSAVAVLSILLTPIMTRLYTPASYGHFAIFNLLVNNISLFASLGYPQAFVQPRRHRHFLALVQLCLILAVGTFGLAMLSTLLLRGPFYGLLQTQQLGRWVYAFPFTVLIFNLYMVLNGWYLRTKDFRRRAGVEVLTTIAGRVLTLGYGWAVSGAVGGLILGDIFAKSIGFISLLLGGFRQHWRELFTSFSPRRLWLVAWVYRAYPLFVFPTSYLNGLAAQLPIFFLAPQFGPTTVGLYTFSATLLELPISLIGSAIGPVFLQKATEVYQREPHRLAGLCLALYYKLLYVGAVPFGVLSLFGDWIFRFAFGNRWEGAGLFTAYLGYYYLFRLTSYAVGPVYVVLQRQRLLLLATGLLLVVRAVGFVIGEYVHSLDLSMQLFGLSSLVVIFGFDLYTLSLLHINIKSVAARSLSLVLLVVLSLWGLRLGIQAVVGPVFEVGVNQGYLTK